MAQDARGDGPEECQRIRGFVEEQRGFQAKIRRTLAGHPRYGPALEEGPLAQAFRLLQVWDRLSLLMLTGPLPTTALEEVPLAPRDGRTLTLEPYPFAEAPFTVRADGRWMAQRAFRHNALFRRALDEAQVVGVEVVVDKG